MAGSRAISINFNLAESEEMREDREYLEKRSCELNPPKVIRDAVLALGEPSDEIVKLARETERGSHRDVHARPSFHQRPALWRTADKVRHQVDIPVLLLKVKN